MCMPKTTYSLIRSDVKLVCDWLKKFKFSDGFVFNSENYSQYIRMHYHRIKRHDYYVLMQRVFLVVLWDLIPLGLMNALTKLSNFFKDISC